MMIWHDCCDFNIDLNCPQTQETEFLADSVSYDEVLSQKTWFLTARKTKKPGFWLILSAITKYCRKKPGF
ncbi:hypothetical protein [Tychonema sp. LEGE 06208]|uniref:hypothetical protein n=1 Tax=Tychonema sp. LEGE 06208 TaxID=1828663 RepID=UPI00187E9646|nr:hypothetical protein [Tychonema sp. LEGE 06208]MBE9161799.1 hypothetical protein [Tychonema sp. LEGE 06208]